MIMAGIPETSSAIAVQPVCQSKSTPDLPRSILYFYIDPSVPINFQPKLEAAMRWWASILNVNTERCFNCKGTEPIFFRFVSGDHGDQFPFLKWSYKIAHVVLVKPDKHFPEIHFNADSLLSGTEDPDIYFVALHEIGHAFGLLHSDDSMSIMYPVYQRRDSLSDLELRSIVLKMRLGNFSTEVSETQKHISPLCEGVTKTADSFRSILK